MTGDRTQYSQCSTCVIFSFGRKKPKPAQCGIVAKRSKSTRRDRNDNEILLFYVCEVNIGGNGSKYIACYKVVLNVVFFEVCLSFLWLSLPCNSLSVTAAYTTYVRVKLVRSAPMLNMWPSRSCYFIRYSE